MKDEVREWGLYILCALLLAAVVISAWLQVPELEPVQIIPAPTAGWTEPGRDTSVTDPAEGDKIRLNTATVEDLMWLPGLGEKTARSILDYRDLHGGFQRVEELLQIEGIGSKKLEQWLPYITL